MMPEPHRCATWPFPCHRCGWLASCRCILNHDDAREATDAVRQRHAAAVARATHRTEVAA